jgi:preprotein translocase subunit SecA
VHPLRASLDEIAGTREFVKVQELLDGNERERVVALGGLHILATERHEARRIDNQLRGRAGRQGDPGSSRFYLSLQDDLMRIFGSERISGLMLKLGMEEGVPIEHGLVTRSIERAQKQVEAQNFGIRKHLLEYDDVMNKQRTAVYDMRRMILEGKDTREHVLSLGREVVEWYLDNYCNEKDDPGSWLLESLQNATKETFGFEPTLSELRTMGRQEMAEALVSRARAKYDEKERMVGRERMLFHQRLIMLQIVDTQWKDHLYALDHLKEGIGLRGYGQRDPLVEYKKESFQMFQGLMDRIDEEILRWIFLYQPVEAPGTGSEVASERPLTAAQDHQPVRATARDREPELAMAGARAVPRNLTYNDPSATPSGFARAAQPREAEGGTGANVQTIRREGKKVGRNDPCPCGSGKKYKKCHGAT